jgi:hypothetical protein
MTMPASLKTFLILWRFRSFAKARRPAVTETLPRARRVDWRTL